MSKFWSAVVSFALFLGLAGQVRAAPVEIVDALGRNVMVEAPAQRVIVNFNFEEFTAVVGVEGWSRVVGYSRSAWEGWRPAIFSRYRAVIPRLAQIPEIGNSEDNNFSLEKVLALKPDVLFLSEWNFRAIKERLPDLEAAGIPVVVIDYNAQLLERHIASTRAFGKAMGRDKQAEEVIDFYRHRYDDVLARVQKEKAAGRNAPVAYVELGMAGPETVGNSYNGAMWGRLLDIMGARNIANGKLAGAWGPLNAEAVIAENPEAIFIAGSSWANRPRSVRTGFDVTSEQTIASLAPYAARAGWHDLRAVRSGNVNAIEHGLSRTLLDFAAMQFIGKRLYPTAFLDIDPVESLKEFHERFLPVRFEGNWMSSLKP